MDDRYKVHVRVDITDADGNPFFEDETTWHGVRYVQVVAIEDVLAGAMQRLIDMSYASAEARGADPQEVAFVRKGARG